MGVAQRDEPRRLVLRRDVALHRRGIRPQRPRPAAEQFDHRLAGDTSVQIPERSVEPGERAATVTARVLVLLLLDPVDERLDVGRVATQHPRHDLSVEHGRRDVGVVGGGLPPTDRARVGRDLDEADELVGEGLELRDLHGRRFMAAAMLAHGRRRTHLECDPRLPDCAPRCRHRRASSSDLEVAGALFIIEG